MFGKKCSTCEAIVGGLFGPKNFGEKKAPLCEGCAKKSQMGMARLLRYVSGDAILTDPSLFAQRIAESIVKEGESSIQDLARLIVDLTVSRSSKLGIVLRVASKIGPLPELSTAIGRVSHTSGISPVPGRYPPEIAGADGVAWTDGTEKDLTDLATEILRNWGKVRAPELAADDLAAIPLSDQERLAKDPATDSATLSILAMSNEMAVVVAAAANPHTPSDTLRKLNERFSVPGRRLYWQFANNQNCPGDLLREVVERCNNPDTVALARKHANFTRGD